MEFCEGYVPGGSREKRSVRKTRRRLATAPARAIYSEISFGGVLRDPTFNQLPHQCGRQRAVRGKTNGALAGVVVLEFVLVGFHRVSTGIEGTVVLGRAKGDQQSAAQTEAWNSVADALFRLGRRGLDDPAKLLKRRSLLFAQRRQVFVDGLWFSFHEFWFLSIRAP